MKNKNQLREQISETVSSTTDDIVTYYFNFKPDYSLIKNLKELSNLFEELKQAGKVLILPSIEDLPDLPDLNPYVCFITWEIILSTSYKPDRIKNLFKGILSDESISLELICNYNALRDVFTKTQLIDSKNNNAIIGLEKVKDIILGKEHTHEIMTDSSQKGLSLIIPSEYNSVSNAGKAEPEKENVLTKNEPEEPENEPEVFNSEQINTLKLSELTVHTIEKTKTKIDDCISSGMNLNIILEDISSIDLSYIQLILSLKKTKMENEINIEFKGKVPDPIRKMLDNTGFSFIK